MVGAPWGSNRQLKFLKDRVSRFKEAQADELLLGDFWPTLTGEFFEIWPDQEAENADWETQEEDLGQEQDDVSKIGENSSSAVPVKKSRKKKKAPKKRVPPVFASHDDWFAARTEKIKRWFYNHTSESRKVKKNITLNVSTAISRPLTEEQTYSRMYYSEKVKRNVDLEIASKQADKKDQLAIRAKLTREAYEAESEEVKATVRREKQQADLKRQLELEMVRQEEDGDENPEHTPEEYARYQEAAFELVRGFFTTLQRKTGWAWTVIGGGPCADKSNGAISVFSYHVGADAKAETFGDWNKSYTNSVAAPFHRFCHEVFPEEVRLRRAIEIGNEVEGKESLQRSGREIGELKYQSGGRPGVMPTGAPTCYRDEDSAGASKGGTPIGEAETGAGGEEGRSMRADDDEEAASATSQPTGNATATDVGELGGNDKTGKEDAGKGEAGRAKSRKAKKRRAKGGEGSTDKASAVAGKYGGSGADRSDASTPEGTGASPCPWDHGDLDELKSLMDEASEIASQLDGESNLQDAGFGVQVPEEPSDDEVGVLRLPATSLPEHESAGDGRGVEAPGDPVQNTKGRKRRGCDDFAGGVEERGREKRVRRSIREVPDWVNSMNVSLRADLDDAAWIRLVDIWYQLEQVAFDTTSRLTELSLRPAELTKWVGARARKYDGDPVIDDVRDYARRWLAWWLAMQPACRRAQGRELPLPVEAWMSVDMGGLWKAGSNGLAVLLLGLKWWAPLRDDDGRWGVVVEDLTCCLELFVV